MKRVFEIARKLVLIGISVFLLIISMVRLYESDTNSFAIVFVLALVSYLIADFDQFKRFKGFGIEVEKWERTQAKAQDLIEKLEDLVELYTTQMMTVRIESGRWGSSESLDVVWKKHWAAFDRATSSHDMLGQKINFDSLRRDIENWMIADAAAPYFNYLTSSVMQLRSQVSGRVKAKVSNSSGVITDPSKYSEELRKMNAVKCDFGDAYDNKDSRQISQIFLPKYFQELEVISKQYGLGLEVDEKAIDYLKDISKIESKKGSMLSKGDKSILYDALIYGGRLRSQSGKVIASPT